MDEVVIYDNRSGRQLENQVSMKFFMLVFSNHMIHSGDSLSHIQKIANKRHNDKT